MSSALDRLGPSAVEGQQIAFRWARPEHQGSPPRLWCDLGLGDQLTFDRVDGGWELRIPLPEVDCLEYMFEVPRGDGSTELVLDPGNPHTVDGAFGAHSWLALPSYAAPEWLAWQPVEGERHELEVQGPRAGPVEVSVWQPAGSAGAELPLLLAHDGPEMDELGELTRYVGALVGAGKLPAMRVALLSPGPRDERYAASSAYAEILTRRVVPQVTEQHPTRGLPVLSGQSLGALAALHASWTSPRTFGGLFFQSGSFFTPETDSQESGYRYWKEVTGFVASVHAATRAAPGAPPTTLTCGTAEENHANNRLMLDHLAETGVKVAWGDTRQGHTWTCWRDTLHPHLTDLLTTVWGT